MDLNQSSNATSFRSFALTPEILKNLEAIKFSTPTPIQEKVIPLILAGKDLKGCAQTGTGKTGAYGIPLVNALATTNNGNALILVPTRELAIQVSDLLFQLTRSLKIKIAVIIGGAAMGPQIRALKDNPRIIVATPGRLNDHLKRKVANLQRTNVLVLDEADRMLDMGFIPQINDILRFAPQERQTLLFSATFPEPLKKLAARYLKNPEEITIGSTSKPAAKIVQQNVETTNNQKESKLMDELNTRQGSVLVFARTKRRTDKLARVLLEYGFKAGRIHGDRTQKQRTEAIDSFRRGKYTILVATDIAARGIDIPHIAHVINYDLPMTAEDYIHRVGRTARAGADGNAVNILTPEDRGHWRDISRTLTGAAPMSGGASENNSRPSRGGDNRNNRNRRPQGQQQRRNDRGSRTSTYRSEQRY